MKKLTGASRTMTRDGRQPWLTWSQHRSLLVLVSSGLLALACHWVYLGGHSGRLIEIDRAEPLTAEYLVDVNRADWPEMVQLPGVGETLARRIISDRQARGPFRDIDELDRVEGIGLRTLERMRPYLLPIPKDTDWAGIERETAGNVP